MSPIKVFCHVVELRCLRIGTSPQTQGKVQHIADVNETYISS